MGKEAHVTQRARVSSQFEGGGGADLPQSGALATL